MQAVLDHQTPICRVARNTGDKITQAMGSEETEDVSPRIEPDERLAVQDRRETGEAASSSFEICLERKPLRDIGGRMEETELLDIMIEGQAYLSLISNFSQSSGLRAQLVVDLTTVIYPVVRFVAEFDERFFDGGLTNEVRGSVILLVDTEKSTYDLSLWVDFHPMEAVRDEDKDTMELQLLRAGRTDSLVRGSDFDLSIMLAPTVEFEVPSTDFCRSAPSHPLPSNEPTCRADKELQKRILPAAGRYRYKPQWFPERAMILALYSAVAIGSFLDGADAPDVFPSDRSVAEVARTDALDQKQTAATWLDDREEDRTTDIAPAPKKR